MVDIKVATRSNGALEKANKYFRKKDYESAIRFYREAIAKGRTLDLYSHNLVLALKRAGRYSEASSELYQALARNPESKALNELLYHENKVHIERRQGPMLSVVVPVYNSEKYLEQCLLSILNQSLDDLELIVVNDGSTDRSQDIIDQIAKEDRRVKVIRHSEPSGNPGTPRNHALRLAEGAYVGFVDSDDWIEPDFYSTLINKAVEDAADLVFSGGFHNRREEETEIRRYRPVGFSDYRSPAYKCHESFMIWDKVFSSKLIGAFDIRLGETKAAVDVPFIFKSYYYAQRVSFCHGLVAYNYRRESESSVTVNYRRTSDCNFEISAYEAVESWAKSALVTERYNETIAYKKVSSYIYTLSVIAPKMFDGFFSKVKESFKTIDPKMVERLCQIHQKQHVVNKFNIVLSGTTAQYKREFRPDIHQPKNTGKSITKPIEEQQSFWLNGKNAGIMFFPDWSKRNPYQKLLYASLAKNYDLQVKGYNEQLFCSDLLERNRDIFPYIHLHWLHMFMDFSRDDGADEFIRKLEQAKALGYKIFYTAHNIVSHDSKFPDRERRFRKRAVQYFDYVLVHGDLAKHRIVNEVGVDPAKVSVVPHGTYAGYYPNYVTKKLARNRFELKDDEFVFLFFGNIKGYKGVDQLLDTYGRVSRLRSNVRLIIAGRIFEEETGARIEAVAQNDNSIIFYPGFIEECDAQYYFNAADIVVLPYKRILTSGAALLSFSYCKPIIAPRSGLVPELISSDKQGYLFDTYAEMEKIMLEVTQTERQEHRSHDFKKINEQLSWQKLTLAKPFSEVFSKKMDKSQDALGEKPYEFSLVRILGNDLPFRHDNDQTLRNLKFTLENESEFDRCIKVWVLNRIVDEGKKQSIVALLEKYNKKYIDIPYKKSELFKVPFCYEDLPVDHFKLTADFDKLDERNQVIVDTAILKHKNNYIINNNGARNVALVEGAKLAKWVFPWDGNCFLTDQAWDAITSSLRARSNIEYHVVPMDRILSNDLILSPDYTPNPTEEPQVIFRADAELSFDENLMYGLKPKVDLLKRLGVPGVWENWQNLYPWKKHDIRHDKNTFNYAWSGWVARLFSGSQDQERSARERAINRERGIVNFIKTHDRNAMFSRFERDRLAYYDEGLVNMLGGDLAQATKAGLESMLQTLKNHAEEYLPNPVYSVVDKTTLPPSGNRKDYWHPAPYAWPNPDTKDGLPYIHKDGERVPGTRMYEKESIKYDRTSIQRLFDETVALALAGCLFDDQRYTEKAYKLIRTWFIDQETSMNPHLNYSQVVMGKNDNKGTASGLIETKDFYFLLDAVRLVKRTSLWTSNDETIMNKWCQDFLEWLITSDQGQAEERAKNNHGNAYDLQVYAFAAYLGATETMYEVIIRAFSRLKSHVSEDGKQPHELRRTTTAHYTSFNLHLWISLHTLIKRTTGLSLIDTVQHYAERKHRSALKLASSWVLRHGLLPEWPFKQIDYFDKARYEHIYHSVAAHSPSLKRKYSGQFKSFSEAKDVYFPHDGIAPFWKLSLVT